MLNFNHVPLFLFDWTFIQIEITRLIKTQKQWESLNQRGTVAICLFSSSIFWDNISYLHRLLTQCKWKCHPWKYCEKLNTNQSSCFYSVCMRSMVRLAPCYKNQEVHDRPMWHMMWHQNCHETLTAHERRFLCLHAKVSLSLISSYMIVRMCLMVQPH